MQIQVSTEHAIRIVWYLHRHGRGVHATQDISNALNVSYPLFIKIAGMLKRAGILSAVQGRNGGYQLSKPASEVSLYDILLATEGEVKLLRRHNGADNPCEVRSYFQEVQETVIDALSRRNVAEL